jgi:hypothetical protein
MENHYGNHRFDYESHRMVEVRTDDYESNVLAEIRGSYENRHRRYKGKIQSIEYRVNNKDRIKHRLNELAERKRSVRNLIEGRDHEHERHELLDHSTTFLKTARDLALKDEFHAADVASKIAKIAIEAALDFTPGVSWIKDTYEALTGVNAVTKEKLDHFDRSIAILGTLTFGFGSKVGGAIKALDKISSVGKIWTSKRAKSSVVNAWEHYKKHRHEFPNIANAVDYVKKTKKFVKNPPQGTLVKFRARNGDTLFYHEATNTFAIMDKHGTPRTMYKPKGKIRYWEGVE